jgi:hypothetical protein
LWDTGSAAVYGGGMEWRLRVPELEWWWWRAEEGAMDEMGMGEDAVELDGSGGAEKLGQVPRLRCSDAVREGLEAENTAEQRAQRSLTALGGMPVSAAGTRTGSRCAQYQAPLPLTAFARTVRRPSYRFCAAASSPPIGGDACSSLAAAAVDMPIAAPAKNGRGRTNQPTKRSRGGWKKKIGTAFPLTNPAIQSGGSVEFLLSTTGD